MAVVATQSRSFRLRGMSVAGFTGIGGTVVVSVAALFLFCGLLCIIDAMLKDRSRVVFLLIGLLLGPVGLIVTGMIPPALSGESRDETGSMPKYLPDSDR